MIICKECVYSSMNMEGGALECRRNPPSPVLVPGNGPQGPTISLMGFFPPVEPTKWCAEGTNEKGEDNLILAEEEVSNHDQKS